MDQYPKPLYPTTPVLSWDSFRGGRKHSVSSILDAGESRHLTSGRMAIGIALKLMGIGPGDRVLVPAYHCTSMVSPAIWTGAECDFFRIRSDTSVDLEDIQSRLDDRTRVLMVPHYFGFPQQSRQLREFCDRHRLLMLEDCAHAFFGVQDEKPLGGFGDYAIASPMKFFPIFDGGCLVSTRHPLPDTLLLGGGAAFQFKAALNNLEKALQYGRLRPANLLLRLPLYVKDRLWSSIKSHSRDSGSRFIQSPPSSEGGFDFDPDWINKKISLSSLWLLKLSSTQRIIELRRRNYFRLLEALQDLPGGRPLHPALPEHVVPYMFPMYVDDPATVFPVLMRQGVPMLRFAEQLWPSMEPDRCTVSKRYSQHLFQFACHQELQSWELDWMIERIRAALSS